MKTPLTALRAFRRGLAPLLFSFGVSIACAAAAEPIVIPVWAGDAPGSEGRTAAETVRLYENTERIVSNVHQPTLTVYLPEKPAPGHAGVLVIPGGGHRELWMDHEGYAIAEALRVRGIAAFVLKYRLAREPGSTYTIEQHSLADTQRALQLIRSRAGKWSVDPAHLGVIGFSAGGELAALASARFLPGNSAATDPVARESSRPAFQGLIYPGNAQAIAPTKDSPPAFLLCGEKDDPGISNELPKAYLRFREAGVSAELHILAGTEHGFGLRPTNNGARVHWIDTFVDWLGDVTAPPK